MSAQLEHYRGALTDEANFEEEPSGSVLFVHRHVALAKGALAPVQLEGESTINRIGGSDVGAPKPGPRLADATSAMPAKPISKLGARLREIRARAIAKGIKLLSADEIAAEVSRMRGDRQS